MLDLRPLRLVKADNSAWAQPQGVDAPRLYWSTGSTEYRVEVLYERAL